MILLRKKPASSDSLRNIVLPVRRLSKLAKRYSFSVAQVSFIDELSKILPSNDSALVAVLVLQREVSI